MYLREMPGFSGDLLVDRAALGRGWAFSLHAFRGKALIVQNGSNKSSTVVFLCSCPVSGELLCCPEQNYRVGFSLLSLLKMLL